MSSMGEQCLRPHPSISAHERVCEFNVYLGDEQGLVSWEDVVLLQPSERRSVEMTSMPVPDSGDLGSH